MDIGQAVVAIGGRASRMRRDGYPVAISKSFIQICGQPLLYWNLLSLRQSGVSRLILCADQLVQLHAAEWVLGLLPSSFREVLFFSDAGLGVHGLPYQVISRRSAWLDEVFVFECGHSIMEPDHYRRLFRAKTYDSIVFSAFVPHPSNHRQPVSLVGDQINLLEAIEPGCHALAHPIVADRRYAERLPSLSYDIRRILGHYGSRSELRYVFSDLPPEFDRVAELTAAMPAYFDCISTTLCPPPQHTVARSIYSPETWRTGDLRGKASSILMPWTRSTRTR